MASGAVSPEERAGIEAAIRAGQPRNEIARRFGRGAATVTRIANAAGLGFDRSATETATEARRSDLAARRARLIERCYKRAALELDRLDAIDAGGGYRLVKVAGNGTVVDELVSVPPESDRQSIVTQAAIHLDKALKLEGVDESGAVEAKGMLIRLVDGIRVADTSPSA